MNGKCLRGDNCRYSHAGIDPSSGLAIGDDNAVPEQLIREGAKVPEGARVLPSGGDTDRMAELFKQAGVTTIAEFNAKQKALGFGLPNERERKPPPKASQAEIDEVLPLLQPLPESYRQAILAIPGCLGHILSWKSTSASGAPDNSSLSHVSAMAWPRWFRRAARNRHRQAIEQARRWRGGRRCGMNAS